MSFTSWSFAVVMGLYNELNFAVPGTVLLAAYGIVNVIVFIGLRCLVWLLNSNKPAIHVVRG